MSNFDLKKSYEPKPYLDLFSLGLKEPPTYENSQAVIVPFGYEGTVTFGHGTAKGPEGLIHASSQVETFDDELLDDVFNQIKIWTTQQPNLPQDAMAACELLERVTDQIIKDQKLPVVIGGEHSISFGFAKAIAKNYSEVSILVFDSHLDLGDQWSNKDFTHAAWLKYSLNNLPQMKSATLLGIRNFNKLEWQYWKENLNRVTVFQAKEKKSWNADQILHSIPSGNVYLSFDIDTFDSSVMPSTGTPEPGGLFWDDILPIIKTIAEHKNIVGIDIVELAPITGLHAPDFVAAKLLLKMLVYKYKARELSKATYGQWDTVNA